MKLGIRGATWHRASAREAFCVPIRHCASTPRKMACSYNHPKQLPLLVLVSLFGVLLSSWTGLAASPPGHTTACPDKRGYETLTAYLPLYKSGMQYPSDPADGLQLTSVDDAFSSCSGDPSCIAFSTRASTLNLGRLLSWAKLEGSCTWVKRSTWKPKTGFKLFPMTSWSISDGFGSPNLITTASAAVAEAQCRSNSSCVGFNTDGQYLVAPSYVSTYIGAPNPSALYMKQYCTERFGYISKPDTALRPVPAQFGIAEGKAESEAQAAEFCRLNYACTGFSSDGSYIIGGVGEYVSATGICSYVKEPCAPMRGFVAYNDVSFPDDAPDALLARPSKDCFNDVYTQCLNEPKCYAFNNMRYMWNSSAPNIKNDPESAPGMCTYVKISIQSQ
ncbi:hypothetical protein Vafri_14317 [Volvox africanus]|uniref:Uncharacterized protein n=1 Tax=Volvox africanus TaxID=51714 RepID=A0A8J4BD96_9CHLO|nr:hypothetical protein Vafri_14317 [Volvox africanus]